METLIYIAIIGTGLAIYHYAKRPRHVYTERDPYDAETEPFDEPSEFEKGAAKMRAVRHAPPLQGNRRPSFASRLSE